MREERIKLLVSQLIAELIVYTALAVKVIHIILGE